MQDLDTALLRTFVVLAETLSFGQDHKGPQQRRIQILHHSSMKLIKHI